MKNRKGMTLIEVVVAMAIFGIIMVTLFPAFLITNLLNIASKQFTDANFLAQAEIEEIYNYSQTHSLNETILWLDSTYTTPYNCDLVNRICERTEEGFYYTLTYTPDAPTTGVSTIHLIVGSSLQGEESNRSMIEVYFRFRPESSEGV